MEKRGCLGDSQGEKTGVSGEVWSGGRGRGLEPGKQLRHPVLPKWPLTSQTSHIPHPQARMLRVGPRWRGGGKGMYPCRAGPGDLQSRAVAAGPRWVTEFPPPGFP